MREVFEAFLTDPIRINEDVYALWLDGQNANDALADRMRVHSAIPGIGDASKIQELLWRDTVDQYRLFEKLEHYLIQPSLFRTQLLFQIPPLQQHYMVERYYALDGHVTRWLLGKKPTSKLQKDLDEISEQAQQTIKSCRRHMDNLRSIYHVMEDRNFQGVLAHNIVESFLISEKLACEYSCVMFLLHARFEVHPMHRITGFLSWHDLNFFAALLMCHWVPQSKALLAHSQLHRSISSKFRGLYPPSASSNSSTCNSGTATPGSGNVSHPLQQTVVVENGAQIALRTAKEWPRISFLQEKLVPTSVKATIGMELSPRLVNSLRDLKAHLINDSDTLAIYRQTIMTKFMDLLAQETPAATAEDKQQEQHMLQELQSKLYLIVHGFLTIGAGLSQPKELKDLFENLFAMVVQVLKDCLVERKQLNPLFSALIDSLMELDVWYLNVDESRAYFLASWERFLSVCRVMICTVYDRYHGDQ